MTRFGGTASGRKSLVSILFAVVGIFAYFNRNHSQTDYNGFDENFEEKSIDNNTYYVITILMCVEVMIGLLLRHNSMMQRVQWCYTPFVYIMIPYAIENMNTSEINKIIVETGVVCALLVPYFIQLSENFSGVVPYSFL